jgi:hypothetical protein
MKTTCLINFLSLVLAIACDYAFSDVPYFNSVVLNAYHNSLAFLKLLFKGSTV